MFQPWGVMGRGLPGGEFLLPLPFVPFWPPGKPSHIGEGHRLAQATDSNANLTPKYPHRQTQKCCFTWAPPQPGMRMHKANRLPLEKVSSFGNRRPSAYFLGEDREL